MSNGSQLTGQIQSHNIAPVQSRPAQLAARAVWSGWRLALLVVGVCWLMFFYALRDEWQINPQYNYGYVVPLLGAVLFWRRWPGRPTARPPRSAFAIMVTAAVLLSLVLPIRLILEANPEWRLMYWLNGFLVLALSLCLLCFAGGWGWVRYFAPPIAFMLIAVPWPMELEQWVIQGLMRFVAGLTVEVVGWLGIAAVQHGNLIEVGAGLVGIDEACSGVRSMQSALMLSLFLGEMYRFEPVRRVGLIVTSFLFVLAANLARTTFLVWAAAERGMHQMAAWHDLAGILVMVIVLPGLMGLAYLMKPRSSRSVSRAANEPVVLPALPLWPGIAAFVWIGAALLATESWYRTHESNLVPNPRWSVIWPEQNPRFQRAALPVNALAVLRCSNSAAGSWQDDAGNQWSAFLLRWDPGKNSTQLAKGHRPDVCLPATGARLVDDFGQTTMEADGVELPFRHQSFATGGTVLHVFYCLWSDHRAPNETALAEDGSRGSRMRAVLAGKRHLGQQVLEIVIQGPDSRDEAIATLKQQLSDLVRRQ